ncbi:putative glutamine--tRNA ligase [Helianthus annuus]|nr:putative glutamine--tRNA ligase [Helianthus annuus]
MIRLERLEYHVREELNKTASRTMVVLQPLKVVITNLEPNSVIDLDAKKWPDAPNDDASSYYKVNFFSFLCIIWLFVLNSKLNQLTTFTGMATDFRFFGKLATFYMITYVLSFS